MSEKICKYCKSEIDSEAIKCPNCREWLNKTKVSIKNPSFSPLVIIIIALMIYVLLPRIMNEPFKTEVFTYKTSGLILEKVSEKKGKRKINILGNVVNRGDVSWSGIEVEIVYFNEQNEVVNIDSDYLGGKLKPETSRYFKITLGPCNEKEPFNIKDYHHYKISIVSANNY